jgi:hypothetical protein
MQQAQGQQQAPQLP